MGVVQDFHPAVLFLMGAIGLARSLPREDEVLMAIGVDMREQAGDYSDYGLTAVPD
ncbi:MAG: hypothetical protein ABFS39_06040 [Pseudomonadota bacterium]